MLHFGWLDGIYLRYGGCYLEKLDKRLFTGQFRGILVTELVLAATGCVILGVVSLEDSTQQILYGVCIWEYRLRDTRREGRGKGTMEK